MIRLLGAITGSALALAALLVLVGVPQFKAEPKDIARAVLTLPLRAEPVIEEMTLVEAESEPNIEPLVEPTIEPAIESAIEPKTVEVLQPDSQQWYAFWSPFRSEIAASGFITQLQRVTGLDYRVVKIKPGVYEVAFAYAEDGDIPVKLSQISAATGLDMPGT
jgi:hypothetical protein